MWQVALAFFFAFFVSQTLIKRRLALSTKIPDSIPMLVAYVTGIMPLSIIVGLSISHHISWSWWVLFLLTVEGGFIGIFSIVSFKAFKLIPAAHFQTVFQVSAIIIISLGWLLLGEKLSVLQIIGAAFILAAALLAIWAPIRAHRAGHNHIPNLRMGIMLTLISAVTMSIGLVAEKASLQYMDLGAYFIFGFGAQAIGNFLFAIPDMRGFSARSIPRSTVIQATLFGIITNGVGFTYLYALNASDNISLITALKAFALPLTAIAAHFILGERDDNKLLWAAIALGVFGIVITAL